MGLSICLTAKNSSGIQLLHIDHDKESGEFYFCLTGNYNGSDIQIDFDGLSASEMEDVVSLLQRRLSQGQSGGAAGLESKGACSEGDRCVCGGDVPAVRAGCHNWKGQPS